LLFFTLWLKPGQYLIFISKETLTWSATEDPETNQIKENIRFKKEI
jgi:hypothetical protein